MGALTIPKHSADLVEIMSSIGVYYKYAGKFVPNDQYTRELKQLIGPNQNASAYTKKAQVGAYYGFIEWQEPGNRRSAKRITPTGVEFYEAYISKNTIKMKDLIVDALETISFGKNNMGAPSSDSELQPPNIQIRAILDLGGYCTVQEFANILYLMNDEEVTYEAAIDFIIASRSGAALKPPAIVKDYTDLKAILILERWGILVDYGSVNNSKAYALSNISKTTYLNRLSSLPLYNEINVMTRADAAKSAYVGTLQEEIDNYEDFYNKNLDDVPDLNSNPALKASVNNRTPEKTQVKKGRAYKTDSRVIKTALSECNYKCFFDNNHILFKKPNGKNYVEGHHLIPMSYQSDFVNNIDRTENVVALCPHCHKAIHYADKNTKIAYIHKLYALRKKALADAGIPVTEQELLKMYKIN